MNKNQLIQKITEFYEELRIYRGLLSKSRNSMVQIVRNHEEIAAQRSNLNKKYGSLERYIKKLGNYPMRSDVGGGPYPVYEVGLSTDILQRRGPCIDAAIQDLEYMLGRLEGMTDEEYQFVINPKPKVHMVPAINASGWAGGHIGIKDIKNPHKQYWKMVFQKIWNWVKNNLITEIVIGLILAFLIYIFGWNK